MVLDVEHASGLGRILTFREYILSDTLEFESGQFISKQTEEDLAAPDFNLYQPGLFVVSRTHYSNDRGDSLEAA